MTCGGSTQHAPSLVEYTKSTSWLRVFTVCLLALSPAFALTILIELLPLRPPSEGWKANWVFWVRLYLSICVISFGAAIQFTLTNPASGLALKHAFYMAVGVAAGYVLHILILAQYWRFPIPFNSVVGIPIWYVLMYFSALLTIGSKKWRETPEITKQFVATIPLLSVQSLFMLIYPVYNAIFLRLRGPTQVAFILLLPAIKYFMNMLIKRVSTEIPAASIIGLIMAKLFDSLYMFKCMGSAGSLVSGAVLIALDSVQNVYHFRNLHKRVFKIKQDLTNGIEGVGQDDMIQKSTIRVASRSHSIFHHRSAAVSSLSSNMVLPLPQSERKPTATVLITPVTPIQATKEKPSLTQLDEEVQELLLESERIILVEYIECIVPLFYVVYMVVLFYLPNARYYPEMANLDATRLARTLRNIILYTILEFVSLFYVHSFLRRKLKISALHMLANVLERENAALQGVFFTYVTIVLQWTLQHGGGWLSAMCSYCWWVASNITLVYVQVLITRSNSNGPDEHA